MDLLFLLQWSRRKHASFSIAPPSSRHGPNNPRTALQMELHRHSVDMPPWICDVWEHVLSNLTMYPFRCCTDLAHTVELHAIAEHWLHVTASRKSVFDPESFLTVLPCVMEFWQIFATKFCSCHAYRSMSTTPVCSCHQEVVQVFLRSEDVLNDRWWQQRSSPLLVLGVLPCIDDHDKSQESVMF